MGNVVFLFGCRDGLWFDFSQCFLDIVVIHTHDVVPGLKQELQSSMDLILDFRFLKAGLVCLFQTNRPWAGQKDSGLR